MLQDNYLHLCGVIDSLRNIGFNKPGVKKVSFIRKGLAGFVVILYLFFALNAYFVKFVNVKVSNEVKDGWGRVIENDSSVKDAKSYVVANIKRFLWHMFDLIVAAAAAGLFCLLAPKDQETNITKLSQSDSQPASTDST